MRNNFSRLALMGALLVIASALGVRAFATAAPAARVTDATTKGVIQPPGFPTVLICGLPAARAGDSALSQVQTGPVLVPAPTTIVGGSATVLIGGKPAARSGDSTANGDRIVGGCPTVIIGP